MSEVQEICRLLDERGIKYYIYDEDKYSTGIAFDWTDQCGDWMSRIIVTGSCVSAERSYLTPQMAVDMLTKETCHIVDEYGNGWWECDKCGASIVWDDPDEPPGYNYCPSCGRRVVQP